MQIKKDLLSHMKAHHPEFRFVWAESIFYNFCRAHEDNLYDFILFQRDGKTGALAVEVATSYDPCWDGAGNRPIGRNTGLAYLKFGRTGWIEAEREWYIYNNLKPELQLVLAEISGDLQLYAMDYFCRSAQELRSDELLRHGLSLVSQWEPLDEIHRSKLLADWHAAPKHTENPLYQNLEGALCQFAMNHDFPTNQIRSYVNRLLYNFTRPGWSWKNSRI
jgi:hypothetical protein